MDSREISEPRVPTVLAIESSCDESACAIATGLEIRSSVVSTQFETHAPFGGVVPELASRSHLQAMVPVVQEALEQAGGSLQSIQKGATSPLRIDAIAVTECPGLVGALLVGSQMARGLASATGLALIGIHHLEGHLFSACVGDSGQDSQPFRPHLALMISGGHTELVHVRGLGDYDLLGSTRDDAVGEAYDKVSKALGLGYPGGPVIDRMAAKGDGEAISFPRSMLKHPGFDFSFSGLKTAVMLHLERHGQPQTLEALADLCASFQQAVIDVLLTKTLAARRSLGCDRVHVVGGVAANRGLKLAFERASKREGFTLSIPPLRYCGDNAAMIAAAAAARIQAQLKKQNHKNGSTMEALSFPPVDVCSSRALDDLRLKLS